MDRDYMGRDKCNLRVGARLRRFYNGRMPLAVPCVLWTTVESHLTRALPAEACGLLAGQAGTVFQVYPVDNVLRSPTAYRMDPAGQIHAMLAIERDGLDVVGIYHSHPDGPPTPSVTDLKQATYPDVLYLICSRSQAPGWQARAFWLRGDQAVEETLVWTSGDGDGVSQ